MYDSPRSVGVKNEFNSNWDPASPITTQTAVTSGSANNKGSWVTIEASTLRAVYGFYIGIWNASTSANDNRVLFDVGVGGSGNEIVIVPNFLVSTSNLTTESGGGMLYFPLYIPAGQRVAVRVQSNSVSKVCRVMMMFNYGASHMFPIFQSCEALGVVDSGATRGVAVTPGTAAYGSYTDIVTTTKPYKALLIGAGAASTILGNTFISVAIGLASSDLFRRGFITRTNESVTTCNNPLPFFADIPSSSTMQARIWASNPAAISIALYGFR